MSDTTPVTCGVAIEVPSIALYEKSPAPSTERMDTLESVSSPKPSPPGATTVMRLSKFEYDVSSNVGPAAATAMTPGQLAGELVGCELPSLPDATTTVTPDATTAE